MKRTLVICILLISTLLSACGKKTKNDIEEVVEEIVENKVETPQNVVDEIEKIDYNYSEDELIIALGGYMQYMHEFNSSVQIADNIQAWRIITYLIAANKNYYENVYTTYKLILPEDFVLGYVEMLTGSDTAPSLDRVNFVAYNNGNYTLNSFGEFYTIELLNKRSGNNQTTYEMRLYDEAEEKTVCRAEFVVENYDNRFGYFIRQFEYLEGNERVVTGIVIDVDKESVSIGNQMYDGFSTYEFADEKIAKEIGKIKQNEYIRVKVKEDTIIENLSDEPIITIPNNDSIILKEE